MKRIALALFGLSLSSLAQAQAWNFTPQIYSRGGYTLSKDFDKVGSNSPGDIQNRFNFGPWSDESNIFAPALTELTLEAAYGDDFRFYYGVDVLNSNRFLDNSSTPLSERVAYMQFYRGDMSLWFGSRPYRSEAEYLSRAYTFDEKNLTGGGVRFEAVGPLNVDLAYGTKVLQSTDLSAEMANIFINKLEYPLANGMIKTNFELQQFKLRGPEAEVDGNMHAYMAGISYRRWGDRVLDGNLYNQFLAHYGTGFIIQHHMGSVFAFADNQEANRYSDDFEANKLLLQWNGDWKAQRLGIYWANFLSMHSGKHSLGQFEDSEMRWTTMDSFLRAQYGVLENVTVGGEYARRQILREGDGVPSWAQNQGAWRWALMANYHLDGRYFDNPVVSLFVGEMHKDNPTVFFNGRHAENNTHFIRLNYEININ